MKVRIRGKQWTIRRARLGPAEWGRCDDPSVAGREIKVASGLKGEKELEIILHETLHASFWDMDEPVIETVAADLSSILWKMGYRKETKK